MTEPPGRKMKKECALGRNRAHSVIFLIISEKIKKVNRIFLSLTGKNGAEGKNFLLNLGCFQKIHGKTLAKKFFSGYSLTAEKI